MVISSCVLLQTPYHAAVLVAAGMAAFVGNVSTSSCDGEANTAHKVKHQDLKNQDAAAWARDSSSKSHNLHSRCIVDVIFNAFAFIGS